MPISVELPPSRETLGSNFEGEDEADTIATASAAESPGTSGTPNKTDVSVGDPSRRRRRLEHAWPPIGTRLDGQCEGEVYAALVVSAPKLKSGRALQVITGPVMGRIFKSMTAAMLAATARQRRRLGLKGKKGLPKSGWDSWQKPEPKRASA